MQLLRKKINKHSLLLTIAFIFLILPLYRLRYISFMSEQNQGLFRFVDTLYSNFSYLSIIIIIVLWLKERKVSYYDFVLFLFALAILIPTLLHNGNIKGALNIIVPTTSIALLCEWAIKNNALKSFLYALCIILCSLIFSNFICQIIFPEGMWTNYRGFSRNWLIENYNEDIFCYMPALLSAVLLQFSQKVKYYWKSMILLIICFLATINVWSATSLVSMTLIAIFFVIKNKNYPTLFFNVYFYFFVSVSSTLGILLFNIQSHFLFLIKVILKKNATFSERTTLWLRTTEYIKNDWLFGNGIETNERSLSKINFLNPHNYYMDLLYIGGVLLFFLFIILMYICLSKIYKYKKTLLGKIFTLVYLGYFVEFITVSQRNNLGFFILLTLSYYIKEVFLQLSSPEVTNG